MKRIYDRDKERIIEYLSQEPYYCTFILGDMHIYGLDGEVVKIFVDEKDGEISCVLMNYDMDLVLYSKGFFDAKKVSNTLQGLIKDPDYCISGKYESISYLYSYLNSVHQRNTNIATYDLNVLPACIQSDFRTELLTYADAKDLLELYRSVDEFYEKYKNYNLEHMQRAFEGSHIIGVYDKSGILVGSAATTAESKNSAMVVNVCSKYGYRGKGIATLAVSELISVLNKNGLKQVTLYYDNPNAAKLYHKLGFVDKGMYSTLRRG